MTLLQMYPIIVPYDNTPLTEEGAHGMIGAFIFLNIVWLFILIIRLNANKWKLKGIFSYGLNNYDTFQEIYNAAMVGFWAIVILGIAGDFISHLIF